MKKLIYNPFIIPFMIVAIMLILTDATFAYAITPTKTDKQIDERSVGKSFNCDLYKPHPSILNISIGDLLYS